MKLYRTVCSTDWKGRPHHSLALIGTSDDMEWLRQRMDEDVREWMAADVANDRAIESEEEDEGELDVDQLAQELRDDPNLQELWSDEDRFEMDLPSDMLHREFVERCEGELTTTVYHFIEE